MNIFFYQHGYLRARQLDTIKNWSSHNIINIRYFANYKPKNVTKDNALDNNKKLNIRKIIPLINFKLRPENIGVNDITYIWGGILLKGKYIIDIDNPWSITGYNKYAMFLYKYIIKYYLLSSDCLEIRCLSKACRVSLLKLFGEKVFKKSKVHYPFLKIKKEHISKNYEERCRFLFIGTQFEIKGGKALLNSFVSLYKEHNNCELYIVSYVPEKYNEVINKCKGIKVFNADMSREKLYSEFISQSDVLVMPTYGESFGMVILEAIAHGLAVISTDIYAISEMVNHNKNGYLIKPPINIWNNYLPKYNFPNSNKYRQIIDEISIEKFQQQLKLLMKNYTSNHKLLKNAKFNSLKLFNSTFKQCQK